MRKAVLVGTLCILGCGGGVAQFTTSEQKTLLQRLEKQLAEEKLPPIEQLCDQIKKLHERSKLSNEQYAALESVCKHARVGDWEKAKQALQPIIEGQGKS
jgi:DNA-binding transcriptional regulator YiaG